MLSHPIAEYVSTKLRFRVQLCFNTNHSFSFPKQYFPAVEDPIIATVSDKTAEAYKVHINGTQPALLPLLAFEGASKRNRPNLDIGSVVYARVVVADRYMEPEVSCKGMTF